MDKWFYTIFWIGIGVVLVVGGVALKGQDLLSMALLSFGVASLHLRIK
jgi:hypothetical protein